MGILGSTKAQNYVAIPDPNFLSALQEILPAEVFNEAGEMNTEHESVLVLDELDVSFGKMQSLEEVIFYLFEEIVV